MTEGNKEYRKQCTVLAEVSVSFGVLGLLLFPASLHIYRPKVVWYPGYRYAWIPAVLGMIVSLVVIFRVRQHCERNLIKTASIGLVLTAMVTLLSILVPPKYSYALRMVCGCHMAGLGEAIISYADNNNGVYPDPNSWCDQLLEGKYAKTNLYLCVPDYRFQYLTFSLSNPKPGIGKSHYAMNINCKPDSSADTVLLFETTLGWNKHGGAELLTFDNHDGSGCNIVFNDGHATFERRPLELKW